MFVPTGANTAGALNTATSRHKRACVERLQLPGARLVAFGCDRCRIYLSNHALILDVESSFVVKRDAIDTKRSMRQR